MPIPPGQQRIANLRAEQAARQQRPPFPPAYGYGLEARPPAHDPAAYNPLQALEQCVEAFKNVLYDTLSESDLKPWLAPPFRSRTRCVSARAVLNVPAALNAAANAGGVTLAAAQSTITPITVLTPSVAPGFTDAQLLFRLQGSPSQVIKVKSWGITVVNAPDEALEVTVRGAMAGGVPGAPDPAISADGVYRHQEADGILQDEKVLEILVRNRTQALATATALLIEFGICFWSFPVDRYTDDPRKTRLKGGYGVDCT